MINLASSAFFGRKKGRRLRVHKTYLLKYLLPKIAIDVATDKIYHPAEFFHSHTTATSPCFQNYILEIGFGGGEHTSNLALCHPETGIIGVEAFINGVASLLEYIDNNKINNIRIYPNVVQTLLNCLQDSSFSKIFILFADPWPKLRHHKRRLINQTLLNDVARLLTNDGRLYLASDSDEYVHAISKVIYQNSHLRLDNYAQQRPQNWFPTRYEQKALAQGRNCHYFTIIKDKPTLD